MTLLATVSRRGHLAKCVLRTRALEGAERSSAAPRAAGYSAVLGNGLLRPQTVVETQAFGSELGAELHDEK
jgi:hypothetical protein